MVLRLLWDLDGSYALLGWVGVSYAFLRVVGYLIYAFWGVQASFTPFWGGMMSIYAFCGCRGSITPFNEVWGSIRVLHFLVGDKMLLTWPLLMHACMNGFI